VFVSFDSSDQTSRIIMRKAALKTAPTAAAAERLTTISTLGSAEALMTQAPLVAQDMSEPMVISFLPWRPPTGPALTPVVM
jgi:hypothetical protein